MVKRGIPKTIYSDNSKGHNNKGYSQQKPIIEIHYLAEEEVETVTRTRRRTMESRHCNEHQTRTAIQPFGPRYENV